MKSEQNRRRSMACTVESIGQGADDYPGFRFSSPIRLHPAWRNSALHPVRRLWLAPIRPDGPLRSDDSFRVAAFGPSFQRWVCSHRQNLAPAPGDNDEKAQPIVPGILPGSTSSSVLSRSPNAQPAHARALLVFLYLASCHNRHLRVARQPRLALSPERDRKAHAKCDSWCAQPRRRVSRSFDRKTRKYRIKGS